MKKVRYALGAVGAVPVLGLMVPGAAAEAAAHTPKNADKTVSLRHGKVTRDAGCTGTKPISTPNSVNTSQQMGFFYTQEPADDMCIGTVKAWRRGAWPTSDVKWRIRIYAGAGHQRVYSKTGIPARSAHPHGDIGVSAGYGVHRSWGDGPRQGYVQVCTAFYSPELGVAAPLCISPP
jgi:hypothetical protein